jgi:hypothetical protein
MRHTLLKSIERLFSNPETKQVAKPIQSFVDYSEFDENQFLRNQSESYWPGESDIERERRTRHP